MRALASKYSHVIYIGLLAFCMPCLADNNVVHAPISCRDAPSCGNDISLGDAEATYTESIRKALLDERKKPIDMRRESEVKPGVPAKLIGYPTPMFVPMIEGNVCGDRGTVSHYYFWAPASDYVTGQSGLKKLLAHLDSGERLNRYSVIESVTSNASERHIAICESSLVAGVTGIPRNCTTVAIITPEVAWLRGYNRHIPCYASASTRNSSGIDIVFDIKNGPSAQVVVDALMRIIVGRFGLVAEQNASRTDSGEINSVYIKAVGSLRNSKILDSGWREAIDLDVYIRNEAPGTIAVHGVVHALVCRQALGNIVNYSGPSDVQQARYAAEFDKGIADAIKSADSTCSQIDAKTITCKLKAK